ncbi:IS1 family transposase, partial [Candidatus Thiosymbion oneisti]|uniref:IS1 family transposase n=1 Tax=Candidatus Thiosymbion oneisti TaxID=589554 RepID=UPI0010603476
MIVETKVHTCHKCHSKELVKNGRNACGNQQYHCKTCGAYGVLEPQVCYTEEAKDLIIKAYQERSSMRGIERSHGICRQTLRAWLKEKAEQLPPLETTLAPVDPAQTPVLELDELWSFVFIKGNKVWVWIALSRETREVIAYACGDRSIDTCRILWDRIPSAYKKAMVFTDYWEAYQAVIPDDQHHPIGKETGETAHVERWNNTLRQHLARFVHKTLSFSKCIIMHEVCLKLFLHRYN